MVNCADFKTKLMNLFKKILSIVLVSVLIYACGSETTEETPDFDHEAQALKDNDSLVKFLKSHYYNAVTKEVLPIDNSQSSIFGDNRLQTLDINEFDVDYKLYVLKLNEGASTNPVKDFPTKMDSVLVKYKGLRIVTNDTLKVFDNRELTPTWFSLAGVIRGWANSLIEFKGGDNVTMVNQPLTYSNFGKGVIFIPSGLAYRNTGVASNAIVNENSNLFFYFDLLDIVEDTDHDGDGIISINEDPDGDGDPRNDDTDKDGVANYLDRDDDGDGILTKDEDTNGNGNYEDDDDDGDNIPNYLDPDNAV